MSDAASLSPDSDETPSKAIEWLEIIDKSERSFAPWRERVRKIIRIFTEQRRSENRSKRRYAMLWANTSTLQPVVYARPPQPVVVRRFRDKDRVAKEAGEVVERALIYTLDKTNFDSMMRNARDDYLLAGRGTAWVRYEADLEPMLDENGEQAQDGEGQPAEQVTDERVICDYVNWADFGHTPARRWEEVTAVWRRVFMDRGALIKRFGDKVGKAIALDHKPESSSKSDQSDNNKKATIYELWDKTSRKVIWLAKGYPDICDEKDPLLDFEDFFPCPKPALSTTPTDSLIPTPDYVFYQDQAEQIDDLTSKIDTMTDSLKLVGFYPGGTDGTSAIIKALKPDSTDVLIPVPGWSAFAEKGGSRQIDWVPIDMVVKALTACHENRQLLIQDIFQITGISDIVRGESNPQTTATAENLKSQWGSIRIRDRQAEIQRFARDLIRLMGEVISTKFQPETLNSMTGLNLPSRAEVEQQIAQMQQQAQQAAMMGHNGGPPMQGMPPQGPQPTPQAPMGGPPTAQAAPPQQAMQPPQLDPDKIPVSLEDVMELLHDDLLKSFRLDVETDSTIAPDEQADKASWNELLTAVSGFMQQAMPMGMQVPELVPVLGEMLLSTVRKYRAGKSLEDAVETAMEQIGEKAKMQQGAPPPPTPEMQKAQADIAINQQKAQSDMELDKQKAANDDAISQRQMALDEQKHNAEQARMGNEHIQKMAVIDNEHKAKMATVSNDMDMRMRQHRADMAIKGHEALMDAENDNAAEGAEKKAPIDKMATAVETVGKEFADSLKQLGQMLMDHTAQHSQAVVKAVTAPRRVVYDPKTGRPMGAETIQ